MDWYEKKYILYVIICLAYLSNGIDLALVGPAVKVWIKRMESL